MEFIKICKDRYMIKDSNNRIVDEITKLKLEKKELVLEDIKGCECQAETTQKITKINKRIKKIEKEQRNEPNTIEETTAITK